MPLKPEDMCPHCSAWHGVPPLENLKPGEPCSHDPKAPCRTCQEPQGPLSTSPGQCSACACGKIRVSERAFEAIIEAIENPQPLSPELVQAGKDYRDAVLSGKLKIS